MSSSKQERCLEETSASSMSTETNCTNDTASHSRCLVSATTSIPSEEYLSSSTNINADDSGGSTLHPVIFVLMWLNVFLTSGGNLLTIVAFLLNKNIYNKPANLLILNLAFADLKVGLVSLPWFNLWWHKGDWVYGEKVCKWWVIVDYSATLESMLAMLLISWDRLWMVRNIQSYVQNQTRQRVGVVVIASWMLAYSYYLLAVLLIEPITGERNIDYSIDCDFPPNYYLSFTIFEVITQFIIPVLALGYLNIKVFHIIRKRAKFVSNNEASAFTAETLADVRPIPNASVPRHHRRAPQVFVIGAAVAPVEIPINEEPASARVPRRNLKDRKAAITLTLLVVTYILCWAPYNVVIIMETLSPKSVSTPVASFTEYLLWLNSVINPCLYVATNTQFRNQLKKMFSCSK